LHKKILQVIRISDKSVSILSGTGIASARAGAKTVGFARSRRALPACGFPNIDSRIEK
jgi:hypothetical protein